MLIGGFMAFALAAAAEPCSGQLIYWSVELRATSSAGRECLQLDAWTSLGDTPIDIRALERRGILMAQFRLGASMSGMHLGPGQEVKTVWNVADTGPVTIAVITDPSTAFNRIEMPSALAETLSRDFAELQGRVDELMVHPGRPGPPHTRLLVTDFQRDGTQLGAATWSCRIRATDSYHCQPQSMRSWRFDEQGHWTRLDSSVAMAN